MKYVRKRKVSPKIIVIIAILLLGAACYAGFRALDFVNKAENHDGNVISSSSKDTEDKNGSNDGNTSINDLTGLEVAKDFKNRRPVAIMINNLKGAQPLFGVLNADVMYECPVEGGITRILAVFKDPRGVKKIGSIRSARPYFINIALGLDAIYMHIGGSEQADAMLNSGVIDSFNLGAYGDMMWRDSGRASSLGYEHSALTSGNMLLEGIEKSKTRTDLNPSYSPTQKFSKKDSQVNSGTEVKSVEAVFSNYKSTSFDYDSEDETYNVSQFDNPQMDDNAKAQNTKQNIILIKTSVKTINTSNDLKTVDVIGSGSGMYISHGKKIDINWKKQSANEPFKYTTSDGQELVMMPGQSYVCVLPIDADININ